MASSVGTQHRAEIRRSRRKASNSGPSRPGPAGLGTSVAPAIQGTHVSSTEKSKAMVIPW
ncbi:hypothetical protein GCM10020000_04470 [Streptomyces olivoverticillatus]